MNTNFRKSISIPPYYSESHTDIMYPQLSTSAPNIHYNLRSINYFSSNIYNSFNFKLNRHNTVKYFSK